jgi:hypothetical protein
VSWDYDRSLQRAQDKYEETEGLTVTPVLRELDFDNISLREPRRVRAAHLYVDVCNFTALLGHSAEAGTDQEEDMVRRLHLYGREVTRVVEEDLDATKVHFQGPKLHALAYRPLSSDVDMVVKGVLAAAAIRETAKVFNEIFAISGTDAWQTAAGVDFGEAIVTKDGVGGDRELLFLGHPANMAAKIIRGGLRLTSEVVALLPDSFDEYLAEAADDPNVMCFAPSLAALEDLIRDHGYAWTREQTRKRLEADVELYPAGTTVVTGARGPIDKSRLSIYNTKRVDGVSLFADVDGFTAYVDQATAVDDDLVEAVRAYHVIRSEMRNTAVVDFKGLRIQYQGDRMQVFAYLPLDDEEEAAVRAVRIAAALNSVVTDVLPQVIGEAAKPLAIGLAAGTTLVSRLGEHGNRDVVSLGSATVEAARIQVGLDGEEIGLDAELYSRLPDWLQKAFAWRKSPGAYVAVGLTLDELERLEAAERPDPAKALLAAGAVGAGLALGAGAAALIRRRAERTEPPLRPWHPSA